MPGMGVGSLSDRNFESPTEALASLSESNPRRQVRLAVESLRGLRGRGQGVQYLSAKSTETRRQNWIRYARHDDAGKMKAQEKDVTLALASSSFCCGHSDLVL